jgi:carnitine O-palmitoyltransferase 2
MTDVFLDSTSHRAETDSDAFAAPSNDSNATLNTAEELRWNVSPEVSAAIRAARKKLDSVRDSLETSYAFDTGVSVDDFKALKMSPDGCVQMAYQIAYFQMYRRTVSTYESASTATFKHGRTEVIRPVSTASRRMQIAFLSENSTAEKKSAALAAALKWHREQASQCKEGAGIDRHLFALQKLALEGGLVRQPEVFQLPSFASLQRNVISTSTVASPAIRAGGFGPVTDDGLGIGYLFNREGLELNVSSYVPDRTAEFCARVSQSLRDIRDLGTALK